MSSLNIVQVVHGFPPREQAGTELYVFYLSKGLQGRHQVTVFHREADPSKEDYTVVEELYEGLPVTRVVNNLRRVDFPGRYYRDEQIDAIFSSYLTRQKPDLVHCHHCIGLSAGLIEMALRMGFPCIVTLHDYWFLCSRVQLVKGDGSPCLGPSEGVSCVPCLYGVEAAGEPRMPEAERAGLLLARRTLRQRLKPYLPALVKDMVKGKLGYRPLALGQTRAELLGELVFRTQYLRDLLNRADRVIAPSEFVRSTMVGHGVSPGLLQTITHGWDGWKPAVAEGQRPFDPRRVRFAYFGTLYPYKGVGDLIKAFAGLPGGHDLLVYGYGIQSSYERELRRLARGKAVHFKGRYEHRHLPSLLEEVDVVVVPSRWPETFGLVVREAFAARRPVIAARIGALSEAFREGEGGLFFAPGDVDGLRERMALFAEDPGQYRDLASRAPAVKDMGEHVDEMEATYREVLAQRASGTPHTERGPLRSRASGR